MKKVAIIWLRHDLRFHDNPAIQTALAEGYAVLPIYIDDTDMPAQEKLGGARRWWLHYALKDLSHTLFSHHLKLVLRKGSALKILQQISQDIAADAIFTTRPLSPYDKDIIQKLSLFCDKQNLTLKQTSGQLLLDDPAIFLNKSGQPYKVFTPFWKALLQQFSHSAPSVTKTTPKVSAIEDFSLVKTDNLESWALLPTTPNWAKYFSYIWNPTEAAAHDRLKDFISGNLPHYQHQRDIPASDSTSALSPWLACGQISPRRIWADMQHHMDQHPDQANATMAYLRQLAWRDFSYYLLHHFPHMPTRALNNRFNHFPWDHNPDALHKWQQGQTGYPFIDAAMRQLWQTGTTPNRLRMVTASFLTKNLRIDWRLGERWFWDTLVDADIANNTAGWQWVAGSGADAAPYFRIFNPLRQSEKFDPEGNYIRQWLPELAALPNNHLHAPWAAPASVLQQAQVVIGGNYPAPLIDHGTTRNAALAAYHSLPK